MIEDHDQLPPKVTDSGDPPAGAPQKKKKEDNFFVFLLKLAVLVFVFRSFIFSPFNIPSESMLPRLQNGDYLLAAKWPYGYSKYSLPWSLPLIPGRLFASQPERGEIVIFKAPPKNDVDYIKRVIGLPGDQILVRGGVLHLNGQAIPKQRVADFETTVTPNTHCFQSQFAAKRADGTDVCRYPRYRETLPNGASYFVLDFDAAPANPWGIDPDNTETVVVPEAHIFVMGDNRDNSMDSRFPAGPTNGVGIIPQENLVGRATIMMFSTDGSSSWIKPWTWFTAARWSRIGGTF